MIPREWPQFPLKPNDDCGRVINIGLCKESSGFECELYYLRKLLSLTLSFFIDKWDNSIPFLIVVIKYQNVYTNAKFDV